MREDGLLPHSTISHAINDAPLTPSDSFMERHDRPEHRGGLASWQEYRAKALLRGNHDRSMTIAQIASACGHSRGHFTRAFRKSTGLAPLQWRNTLRVDIAKNLLRVSDLTLLDVALECGFADEAHLSRIFRGLTGYSPGKWRRNPVAPAASLFAAHPAHQTF